MDRFKGGCWIIILIQLREALFRDGADFSLTETFTSGGVVVGEAVRILWGGMGGTARILLGARAAPPVRTHAQSHRRSASSAATGIAGDRRTTEESIGVVI
jgi:hypothetical protein